VKQNLGILRGSKIFLIYKRVDQECDAFLLFIANIRELKVFNAQRVTRPHDHIPLYRVGLFLVLLVSTDLLLITYGQGLRLSTSSFGPRCYKVLNSPDQQPRKSITPLTSIMSTTFFANVSSGPTLTIVGCGTVMIPAPPNPPLLTSIRDNGYCHSFWHSFLYGKYTLYTFTFYAS